VIAIVFIKDLFRTPFCFTFILAARFNNGYFLGIVTNFWKEVKKKIMERVEKALKLPDTPFQLPDKKSLQDGTPKTVIP